MHYVSEIASKLGIPAGSVAVAAPPSDGGCGGPAGAPFEAVPRKKMRSARIGLCLVMLAVASCGDDGGAEIEPPFSLALLAGDIGGPGNSDGPAAEARFSNPADMAFDSAGNLYVADSGNHTIRKVTPAGVVTTLAGAPGITGSADGTGAAARFFAPTGVAIGSNGDVYVADRLNDTIRKITAAGVVTTLAGTAGAHDGADGTGAAAHFSFPASVAVDGAGNLYVADEGNQTIRKVTAAGVVTTLAGTAGSGGSADGTGAAARFGRPVGVAIDSAGNLYVADQSNFTIRKVTAAGVVTTLAGTPGIFDSVDGTGAAASFFAPSGVAVDSAGIVYVADRNNNTLRKITAAGVVTTLAGTPRIIGSADSAGAAARFDWPTSVEIDSSGNVYVADLNNHTLRKVTAAGVVTTLAGRALGVGSENGTGAAARFFAPAGVAADSAGNVYVADGNATIRKITTTGVVTTLAGTVGTLDSVDGTGTAAHFLSPRAVAVDRAGNLYVVDNHAIRKVTAAGGAMTLAGTASAPGSNDGTGPTAGFAFPSGIAVDRAGTVYVADRDNATIRKVTAEGVVTTLAGAAHFSGSADGTGAAASFKEPAGVAVDNAGNVYVADRGNSTIRKVTAAGVVTTLAGTAGMTGSADGAGVAARFHHPSGVAVDSAGNVYVADQDSSTIRKITPTGTTTTIAGTAGTAGILLGATPRLAFPRSLAIDGDSIVVIDAAAVLRLETKR
jgi:NHL repeat